MQYGGHTRYCCSLIKSHQIINRYFFSLPSKSKIKTSNKNKKIILELPKNLEQNPCTNSAGVVQTWGYRRGPRQLAALSNGRSADRGRGPVQQTAGLGPARLRPHLRQREHGRGGDGHNGQSKVWASSFPQSLLTPSLESVSYAYPFSRPVYNFLTIIIYSTLESVLIVDAIVVVVCVYPLKFPWISL